ncbi:unnamed protein product [Phaedon cochleariae]|uniref:Peptidase S1 domain-containing protein n=1 Tax=Phaedon cochleariae TaxID=80249 RepID=A0A9P0GN36_PHACE|nr:unnamed protein product [Phaedon cochleariae]
MFASAVFLLISFTFAHNAVSSASLNESLPKLPGDTANKMCKTYAKYALDSSASSCAFEKENLNSNGATDRLASRKEFPHMVQLGFHRQNTTLWGCGGILISDRFVLTAAQCAVTREYDAAKFVRAGITNVNDKNHLQIRYIEETIIHPDFNSDTFYHNIALLKVNSSFDMNSYVRPACLHTIRNIPFRNGIATGWGNTNFTGELSEDLKKIKLEIFDSAKCNKTYRRAIVGPNARLPNGFVDDLLICAGSSEDKRSTCQGDSGGPFQIYREDTEDIKCMYSIVGIISFGKACGLVKDVPEGHTRVFPYIQWIEDKVWS